MNVHRSPRPPPPRPKHLRSRATICSSFWARGRPEGRACGLGREDRVETGSPMSGSPLAQETCFSFRNKYLSFVFGQTIYSKNSEKGKAKRAGTGTDPEHLRSFEKLFNPLLRGVATAPPSTGCVEHIKNGPHVQHDRSCHIWCSFSALHWQLAAALFRGLRTVDRQRCFHQPSAVFRSGILKQFQHDGIKRGLESGKSEIPYRDITG